MDYKFRFKMYQESAGDENAKVNIFIDGTQVITEQEITSTDSANPTIFTVEATGLPDPNSDGSVTADMKIALANDYYVDSSTDRNAVLVEVGYANKYAGTTAWTYSDGTSPGEGYYHFPGDGGNNAQLITDWNSVILPISSTTGLINSLSGEDWPSGITYSDGDFITITTNSGLTLELSLTHVAADEIG